MQTILHLTDIHFGWEGDSQQGIADRKVCLNGLLAELKNLDAEWKPTVICLTGDIGWRGVESDYLAAKEWLDQVLEICGLGYDSLIVCAGNHDVVRNIAKKLPRPESAKEADEVLAAPVAAHFESPFSPFVSFCQTTGIQALSFGSSKSYLVGERSVNGSRFVVLNSAWFCKDDYDKGKLWMGYPHMTFMEGHDQLVLNPSPDDRITVALVHHPQEWYQDAEIHAYASRPNVMDHLANRCHLILTGHTHGEVRQPDRIADRALHFTGGSAYAGASHFNSFRIIHVKNGSVADRSFEFDPTAAGTKWRSSEARSRPLSHIQRTELETSETKIPFATTDLRASCRKEAIRIVELKSRLLKQSGPLPAIIQRPVSLRVSDQRDTFDETGRLVRSKDAEQTLSFYEAVRQARRTLVLGDLGTGKSTLAAQLVIETLEHSESTVAILIPVKALRLAGHFTRRDLLTSVANYVTDGVWLKSNGFALEHLLDQQVEVLLVFDGLDELPRDLAGRLLSEASAIVENWPTIQVVATARPVELAGASFSDWRIIHTVSLDDAAKIEFFKQELIAEGEAEGLVEVKAIALLRSLKENTSLDSIANSPLAIRLIYPRLGALNTNGNLTLGDLLCDVLMDRLDGWEKRDDKPSAFLHLNQVLPTAAAKAEYLAVLALRNATGKQLQREEAKSLFYDAGSEIDGANRHLLADEALSYFEWLGILSVSDTVDFPLQPLAEICAAMGLVAQWHSSSQGSYVQDRAQWRVVSFAAAIARRRGLIEKLRDNLESAISFLLAEPGIVPAACYIVVESADPSLARIAIRLIDNIEYRPLRYFQDERRASARNIAKTLVLAGDAGFDWFFADYLNPRYPTPNYGSAVVGDVFAEWAALERPSLTSIQTEKLGSLVELYQAAGEGYFYGALAILSVLVPSAFTPEERILQQSIALDRPLFTDWVEGEFRTASDDPNLEPILDGVLMARCSGSTSAARLWLERNKTSVLPHGLVRLAMRSVAHYEKSTSALAIATQCQERLGDDKWSQYARWFVTSEDRGVSVGAAKVLFNRGERRLSVLGDVAMAAMHDGGYFADAENILSELISHKGENGVRWLADRIARSEEWHGGYSGWWRVLLPLIADIEDGPRMLAYCVRNLGPYTIPRRPEVREAFAQVLKGPRGSECRDALRKQLKSFDPDARRSSALILTTADPRGEADALFVGVRSRANRDGFEWREWETFLLTLEFGPSVLSSLKGRLEQLESQSRALAFVLLDKGGYRLDPNQSAELMVTLASLGNWHLCREPTGMALLQATSSYERFKEYLKNPGSKLAKYAAEHLLEFHLERLTPKDAAKCWALRFSGTSWSWELAKNFKRIEQDSDFAQNLIAACHEIVEDGGQIPLLGIAAKAITENVGWKDLLWALFCDDTGFGGSSESEVAGMTILEFAFETMHHRQFIGEAAKDCLSDPRFKQNRWHEAYHWVALLADEFGGLDKETIIRVIVHGKPIGYSATIALIARLGFVPENFSSDKQQRRSEALVTPIETRELGVLISELKEFSRESDELHPHLLDTIQETLAYSAIEESTLIGLAAMGKPGILIATLFRFIYGEEQQLSNTIPLLDILAKTHDERQHKPDLKKLVRVWQMVRASVISDDDEAAQTYLVALDRELKEGRVWRLAIAWDILQVRGALLDEQIPMVFDKYADHVSFLHGILYDQLCDWLSMEVSIETRLVLIKAVEHAITKLDEAPWHPKSGETSNPWANLLFPALLWANGGSTSRSAEAVFLRGIRSTFEGIPQSQERQRSKLIGFLSRLEPILNRVPPDVLRSVVSLGSESLEPSVSVFCRIIQAFAAKD